MTARFTAKSRPRARLTEWAADPRRHCKDANTNLFYSARDTSQARAKKICADCPLRQQCLEYALTAGERWGIWAGVLFSSADERRAARVSIGMHSEDPVAA